MLNSIKKTTAAALALILAVSTTACAADKSWAAKTDSLTVPIGAYIYNLYTAYQSASASVKDTTKPVLQQQIDGQSAEAWIKDKALTDTKMLYVLNDKMTELKLSLTADETKSVSSSTDTQWEQYGSSFEKYGISKNSFNLAYSDYSAKYQKVFSAIYGKGGSKAVSDADLKAYYEKNYTDYEFLYAPLYGTDTSGNATALTADETTALKKKIDAYAADVKAGKKTLEKAAEEYKTADKLSETPYYSTTEILDNNTNFPTEMVTLIKSLKPGEMKATEISGTYVVVQKNDITKKSSEQLTNESNRTTVLSAMKAKEFSEDMEKEAKAYSKAQINQAAIDSYKPSMFETATSSTAATASTAASEAASEAASAIESAASTASSK